MELKEQSSVKHLLELCETCRCPLYIEAMLALFAFNDPDIDSSADAVYDIR